MYIANCVFSSLVAITGSCYLVATWQAFIIGAVAALLCFLSMSSAARWAPRRLDDPCAAFAVHGVAGAWGLLAVGVFARSDPRIEEGRGADGMLAGEKDFDSLFPYTHF